MNCTALPGEYTNRDVTDCFEIWYNGDGTYSLKVTDLLAMEELHPKATYTLAIDDLTIGNPISASTKLNLALTKAKIEQSTKAVTLYSNDRYSTAVVELQLKDNALLDIADVVLEENAKKPSAFEARYLGDGEVEISFKDNQPTTKAGSVKLNVYLEGNNVANGQPNATVSVSVKVTKFKNR